MIEAIDSTEYTTKIEESKGISMIDFWAPWCGPCNMFAPILEEYSSEHSDIKIFKANVDEPAVARLAADFNIRSIPTMIIFKDGKAVKRFSGAVSKQTLEEHVNSID